MKLLIAEDDAFFSNVLQKTLAPHYELVVANDGNAAWLALEAPRPPRLAILDWVMPGLSGPEICRKVRSSPSLSSMYLIIVTARNSSADIVSGLRAGADDYITKPFVPEELQVRIRLGERILASQNPLDSQWRYPQASEPESRLGQNSTHNPFRRCPPSRPDPESALLEPFSSKRDPVASPEAERPAGHSYRFLENFHA
jgi:DNA-binding response OmpR family regulator